jgi:hypothetical protein
MAQGMEPNVDLLVQFPEFATQRPMVHGVGVLASTLNPLMFDRLLHDYIDDMQRPRSPTYAHRHVSEASHDRYLLLSLGSTHTYHHLVQRLHDELVEQNFDKERAHNAEV